MVSVCWIYDIFDMVINEPVLKNSIYSQNGDWKSKTNEFVVYVNIFPFDKKSQLPFKKF